MTKIVVFIFPANNVDFVFQNSLLGCLLSKSMLKYGPSKLWRNIPSSEISLYEFCLLEVRFVLLIIVNKAGQWSSHALRITEVELWPSDWSVLLRVCN